MARNRRAAAAASAVPGGAGRAIAASAVRGIVDQTRGAESVRPPARVTRAPPASSSTAVTSAPVSMRAPCPRAASASASVIWPYPRAGERNVRLPAAPRATRRRARPPGERAATRRRACSPLSSDGSTPQILRA